MNKMKKANVLLDNFVKRVGSHNITVWFVWELGDTTKGNDYVCLRVLATTKEYAEQYKKFIESENRMFMNLNRFVYIEERTWVFNHIYAGEDMSEVVKYARKHKLKGYE